MAARLKLAGANGWEATVPGFRFRKYSGRDKSEASPFPAINMVGEVASAVNRGGTMAGSSELAARTLEGTKTRETWSGRARGEAELTSATNFSGDGSVLRVERGGRRRWFCCTREVEQR